VCADGESNMSAARQALRALAVNHGLSRESLTLIKEVTLPLASPDERLNDTQIRFVIDAVETCLLSGLTDEQIGPTIRAIKARFPTEWRQRFWRQRLTLAAECEDESRAVRPARALTAAPVPPIPPQPPSEIGPNAAPPHGRLAA
jgi:hypothetical protein